MIVFFEEVTPVPTPAPTILNSAPVAIPAAPTVPVSVPLIPTAPPVPPIGVPTLIPTAPPTPSSGDATLIPSASPAPSAPSVVVLTLQPTPTLPTIPPARSGELPTLATSNPTTSFPTTVDELDLDDIFRFDLNVDDIFSNRQIGADDDGVVPPPLAPSSSVSILDSTFEVRPIHYFVRGLFQRPHFVRPAHISYLIAFLPFSE
jgi:hypothetical protein